MTKMSGLDRDRFFEDIAYRREFLIGDASKDLLDKFRKYHALNKEIYAEFVRSTKAMEKTGRERYSAWCIINKIRWDKDIATTGDVFKISNDFIALYARLLILNEPKYIDFFDLKPMKKERGYSEEKLRRIAAGETYDGGPYLLGKETHAPS